MSADTTPAAENTPPAPAANAAQARPAVLHATVQIKRAATGRVETFHITGTPTAPPAVTED